MVPLTRPAGAGHPLPLGEGFAPIFWNRPLLPHHLHKERHHVDHFSDLHGYRFSKSVSCTNVHTNQNWCGTALSGLEGGCELVAMRWNDTIIMIPCCDQRRRICRTGLNVVVWRIREKILEFLRIVRRAVVGGP